MTFVIVCSYCGSCWVVNASVCEWFGVWLPELGNAVSWCNVDDDEDDDEDDDDDSDSEDVKIDSVFYHENTSSCLFTELPYLSI